MSELLDALRGDGRATRGIDLVAVVVENPQFVQDLVAGMMSKEPVLQSRSADLLLKVCMKRSRALSPVKAALLTQVPAVREASVRERLVQMYPHLELSKQERDQALAVLRGWVISEKSPIVKVFALEAMADLAYVDMNLKREVAKLADELVRAGGASVRPRAKAVIMRLER